MEYNNREYILKQILDKIKIFLRFNFNHKSEINWGLYTSILGPIIFLFYYSKWTTKDDDLRFANECLEFYINNIPLDKIHYSYCGGLSGILVGLAHLDKLNFAQIEISCTLPILCDHIINCMNLDLKMHDYDFMHGPVGAGIMGVALNQNKIQNCLFPALQNCIEMNGNRYILFKDYGKLAYNENISLSHGMSNIIIYLSMLSKIDNTFKKEIENILNRCLEYIISQEYINYKDIGSHFPYTSLKETIPSKSRLAWCYGDLGIALAIWRVGMDMNKREWKKFAIKILQDSTLRYNTPDNYVQDACICHGSAGIAQIYHRMYISTSLFAFKKASMYWLNETLRYSKYKNGIAGYKTASRGYLINDYSLLDGISGIGLAILASINNANFSSWDSLFLMSDF